MEFFVSARISNLQVVDPGEIRRVQFALPDYAEIGEIRYSLHDTMRPGTAFLAKPWGMRTAKFRRRMYTRSNSSCTEPGVLETFINHTHRPQADKRQCELGGRQERVDAHMRQLPGLVRRRGLAIRSAIPVVDRTIPGGR